jgi:hypothetical protein
MVYLVVERTEQAVNSCYVAEHGKSTFPHIMRLCVLDGDIDFTRRTAGITRFDDGKA